MYFPANLGIDMLYTTVLLETEPVMKARLMKDLEEWMVLGKTHLQGSFAAFYLAAHAHAEQQQPSQADNIGAAPLTRIANGTVRHPYIHMPAIDRSVSRRCLSLYIHAGD